MAETKITIGSPTLNGKDFEQEVAKTFGAASFPLATKIESFMPRWGHFSYAGGFRLGHVADVAKATAHVKFKDKDDLCKFVSEICQISDSMRLKEAIAITAEIAAPTPTARASTAPAATPTRRTTRSKS